MFKKLIHRLKGELALSLARTFAARGVVVVGGMLLYVILGRLYGAAGMGAFALAQSLYLGAAILARQGMDNALMRYVGQDPASSAVGAYLRLAVARGAVFSTIAALSLLISSQEMSEWFHSPMLAEVLPGLALAIPPFTISLVIGGFMKGLGKPAAAALLENGSISLLGCLIVLVLEALWSTGIENAGLAIAIAAWIVLVMGAVQVKYHMNQRISVKEKDPLLLLENFKSSAHTFFVLGTTQFVQQTVFVLIIGALLGENELGLFKAAERAAFLISFVLLVLNTVLPPRFSKLYYAGDMNGLKKIVRQGVLVGLVLATPLLLVLFIAAERVMNVYGEGFEQGAMLLRIFAIGYFINVISGSFELLLGMTGYERIVRNISLFCCTLGVVILLTIVPHFGAIGAALSFTLLLVVRNLLGVYYVRIKLGFWGLTFFRSCSH